MKDVEASAAADREVVGGYGRVAAESIVERVRQDPLPDRPGRSVENIEARGTVFVAHTDVEQAPLHDRFADVTLEGRAPRDTAVGDADSEAGRAGARERVLTALGDNRRGPRFDGG